jgi:hypothetical protein
MAIIAKAALREDIQSRLNAIQDHWGFNRHGDMTQIPAIAVDFARERGVPEGEHPEILLQAAIAFGKYIALIQLAEEHELHVDCVPEGFCEHVIYLDGVAYSRYRRVEVSK